MLNDVKTVIINSLEEDVVSIAYSINTMSLQGYIVDNSEYCNLSKSIIINELFKNFDSFDKDRQTTLITLYNSL